MSNGASREELEQNIIKTAAEIGIDPQTGCFEEDGLRQFGEAWHQLVNYYNDEAHTDTVISVDVVREYLDTLNLFFGTWKNPKNSSVCQERAVEALQELEAQMRYIIEAVERRLYPYGR